MKKLLPLLLMLLTVLNGNAQQIGSTPGAPFRRGLPNYRQWYYDIQSRSGQGNQAINAFVGSMRQVDSRYIDSAAKAQPGGILPLYNNVSPIGLGVYSTVEPVLNWGKTGTYNSPGRGYPSFLICDSSAVTVVAQGINEQNASQYRYHIVLDNREELIPWSVPKVVRQSATVASHADLGTFKLPSTALLLEVVNINDYGDRQGVFFDWRSLQKPVITNLTGNAYSMTFSLMDNRRGYSTKTNKLTGLPANLKFPAGSIDLLSFDFLDHESMPYDMYVMKDGRPYAFGDSPRNSFHRHIIANHFDLETTAFTDPGTYEILVRTSDSKTAFSPTDIKLPFTVLPPLPGYQTYTLTQLAGYIGMIIFMGCLGFAGYYLYNRGKLQTAQQQQAMATLKLNSVRAQLNPHFMFNALTSIQSLMNRHDTEGANHYLGKFAGLTREILSASGHELISLEDELVIINDYVEMEQLRFGFAYTINVDQQINKANTEIPAMMLQPFIENAAKYGASALREKGRIDISIKREWWPDRLVLTVVDNGYGFGQTRTPGSGFGLKLSEERIALLNQVYPDQPITLQIDTGGGGTTITITLTDWIH